MVSVISVAIKPFQDELQKLELAVAKLQEDTQCGYTDMGESDMETSKARPAPLLLFRRPVFRTNPCSL